MVSKFIRNIQPYIEVYKPAYKQYIKWVFILPVIYGDIRETTQSNINQGGFSGVYFVKVRKNGGIQPFDAAEN